MKLILTHRHHQPSPSFNELVKLRLDSLREDLHIEEARVLVERRLEASPAFRVAAHLVTPGPDILADAVDHTLRAALEKMIRRLETRIVHRHQKRARRAPGPIKKTPPTQLAAAGARN